MVTFGGLTEDFQGNINIKKYLLEKINENDLGFLDIINFCQKCMFFFFIVNNTNNVFKTAL